MRRLKGRDHALEHRMVLFALREKPKDESDSYGPPSEARMLQVGRERERQLIAEAERYATRQRSQAKVVSVDRNLREIA